MTIILPKKFMFKNAFLESSLERFFILTSLSYVGD